MEKFSNDSPEMLAAIFVGIVLTGILFLGIFVKNKSSQGSGTQNFNTILKNGEMGGMVVWEKGKAARTWPYKRSIPKNWKY